MKILLYLAGIIIVGFTSAMLYKAVGLAWKSLAIMVSFAIGFFCMSISMD